MQVRSARSRWQSPAILLGIALTIAACGSKEPPAGGSATANQQGAASAGPDAGTAATAGPSSWTPEALEELLAPVALFPDPVLSQVLIASTNPQEVLDAGNWVIENQALKGKALGDAATKVGFTPPVLALIQFPDTLDMMCRELDWTTQLGEAFTADQAGVLDAIQRLRKQAESVGNLQTSPQMTVDNQTEDGKEVIVLKPASNGEVYVPSYDPVAVYAPPAETTVAPAATTTTTTTESTGHSTGALITTGLLSFGAGMLVNELFDDDDDHYKYPNYGYGGMPYYPPYPYRPAYGNGYYPSNGYRPPSGYGGRYGGNYVNNGNIVVNTGGKDYWNRYEGNGRGTGYGQNRKTSSPITAARPNRPELNELNKRQPRPMPADVKRPSTTQTASDWKGQKSYAGNAKSATDRTGAYKGGGAAGPQARPAPKVQGSYAGGSAKSRDAARQSGGAASTAGRTASNQSAYKGAAGNPASQGAAGKAAKGADRGYSQPAPRPQQQASRPAASQKPSQQDRSRSQQQAANRGGHNTAMSGASQGSADRKASQRGKQSMPQGAHSKGGGHGGGGKAGGGKAGGKKQR